MRFCSTVTCCCGQKIIKMIVLTRGDITAIFFPVGKTFKDTPISLPT